MMSQSSIHPWRFVEQSHSKRGKKINQSKYKAKPMGISIQMVATTNDAFLLYANRMPVHVCSNPLPIKTKTKLRKQKSHIRSKMQMP
jgi:hypothetical protein